MRTKMGLSQEWLKVIACVTMLMDHIGAAFFPWALWWRIVGRMAFPIYCFLLAEGLARTRNMKRYGIRLAIGAVLAEIPFDLLFFGGLTLAHQSVMVTLLIGYFMVLWMRRFPRWKLLALCLCAMAAELLCTDYGTLGVMIIGLFVLTRDMEHRLLFQTVGLLVLNWALNGYWVQMLAVTAMIPIALYNGTKSSHSKAIQRVFYLFYPVHMLMLALLQ